MVRIKSGVSSDSSHSDQENIDHLVDKIISNLSISITPTMTVRDKLKKDRTKKDRKEKAVVERSSASPNPTLESADTLPPEIVSDAMHSHSFNYAHDPTHTLQPPIKRFRDKLDSPTWSPLKVSKKFDHNNSDDECQTETTLQSIEESVGKLEKHLMKQHGWKIYRVKSDGACLFRSVAHQIFGDEERHRTIRQHVMDYMLKNREHFSDFVSEDFDRYVARKRSDTCFGNHLEIQAISELYNRPVEIYRDSAEPMNVHHQDYHDAPIRLSYHSEVHYNSIIDPCNPHFGQGLGMPENLQPPLPESELVKRAVCDSEDLYHDELLLKSALNDAEVDDLDEAIAQQALQESYIAFLEEQAKSKPSCSSLPSQQAACSSTSFKYSRPSTSAAFPADNSTAPKVENTGQCDDALIRLMPAELIGMNEEDVLAFALAQSRHDYMSSIQQERETHVSSNKPGSSNG